MSGARKFYGQMVNGKLKAEGLRYALIELDGQHVEITVKRSTEHKRTTPQNRYIHWMFGFIAQSLSANGDKWTREEVKFWLTMTHLRFEKDMPNGDVVPMVKGTSEMNDAECSSFMERCWQSCAELGIVVPEPGEQVELY